MYNPANLNECEKEVQKKDHREWNDKIMLFVGSIAAFSSAPQVFKIFQTKTVAGISLTTQLFALASVVA